jgi:hypothetical protein
MDRLLSYWAPDLYKHFKDQGFSHDLYLVQWIMTLFSHTLPYQHVVLLWTDLFCEKVEFLFFISVAILIELKEKLMLLDLNTLLSTINNI